KPPSAPPEEKITKIDKTPTPQPLDNPVRTEKPLHFKAPEDVTTETPNDQEFEKAMGESLEALTERPFKGVSTNDSIGGGAGGAGKYGGRIGGNKLRAANSGGGGKETERTVLNALRWLARHQGADGSWEATKHTANCGRVAGFPGLCTPNPGADTFQVGLTGLSLLAFLGAGYTHLSRDIYDGICFGDVVKKGVQYLMRIQDPSGRITPDDVPKYMYNHLLAAFALCEAYGLTDSAMIKEAAQKAVDYTVQAQNPGYAWRYSARSGDNDSSVSGWGAQLLKSAELALLNLPPDAFKGVIAWYDKATEGSYKYTGYLNSERGKVVIPSVNEHFSDHPALTSIAVMTRLFINRRSDPNVRGGADLVIQDLPEWDSRGLKVDMYYWYYASFAMFQFDGPKGPYWNRWNTAIKAALLDTQNSRNDCRSGSWEPVDRWSSEGGRVYTTAMGALTMEVYYRYPNVTMDRPK
ncbi:MAG TPA: prenyltransferase/squalene oxidase repeat-containing protein, partial [Planctomycetota bacterium]|nr:prenyltransferase/squalene oxidase repeat-containing protein [Planctomycetota bacterium]